MGVIREAVSFARGTVQGAKCKDCPFARDEGPNRPVVGEGPDPDKADWIVVGEGPGQTEIALNRPFVGASGQLVNKALTAIGVDRRRLWVTNATLCLPTAEASDTDKDKARKACAPRFVQELSQHPGKAILALGAVATRAVLGSRVGSVQDLAGSYHLADPDGTGKRAVIPTIHPAAILRGGAGLGGAHSPDIAFWNLMYDAAKVAAIAAGKDIVFREEDIVTECFDPNRAEKLIREMVVEARRQRMVAVDTETYVDDEQRHTALQPINAKLSAIGLATPNWGLSVLWGILTPMSKRLIAALLADPNIRKVFHNSIYDKGVLKRHRLPVIGPVTDTLLQHHAAFPGLAHNLQRVGTQYFAIRPWKSEFRQGKDTPENLLVYNAKDTLVCARLDEPLEVAMQRTDSRRCYEVDLFCAEVAEWMYDVGIPISKEVNDQLYKQFWDNMQVAREKIEIRANDPEIREKLWDRLAAEQAKRYRQGSTAKQDPEEFETRKIIRLDEIRLAAEKGAWKWKITAADHVAGWLRVHNVVLPTTDKARVSITKETLKPYLDNPVVKALADWRTGSKKHDPELQKIIEEDANRPEIQDALWQHIAFEQAKKIRKPSGRAADPDDYLERQKVRLTELIDAAEKDAWEWNIGSSDHVAAYLKARGVPLYFQTEKGATSTKKEILEAFVHIPEVRALLDYRENQKLFSTFIYSFFDRHDEAGNIVKYGYVDEHNRVHPRWSVHRITGRWSAEDPMCFDDRTEILTEKGWVYFPALLHGCKVAQFWREDSSIDFVEPTRYVDLPYTGDMIYIENVNLFVTPSHGFPTRLRRGGNAVVSTDTFAEDLSDKHSIAAVDNIDEVVSLTAAKLKLKWVKTTKVARRQWEGHVYCVSVPSTYIVVRRGKNVMITGNCQNWPRDDVTKGRPNLRAQVVAPETRGFVGFDFGQIESRTIALLSGDPWLCNIFSSGKDIHSEFARIVWPNFDTLPQPERKVLRDAVKRAEFGAFYGGQIDTLWNNIKKDHPNTKREDIARMVMLMSSRMPGVTAWHQQLLRDVAQPPHEVRSAIYGRRRCFPLGNAEINDVYNFPVQCGRWDQRVLTTFGWIWYRDLDPRRHTLQQPSGRRTNNFILHDAGVQPIYKLLAEHGTLCCTAGHYFLLDDGNTVSWTRLCDLRVGDHVAVEFSTRAAKFDIVVEIIKQPPAQTFDLEIPGDDHGYVAEGFVVHNSTAADIMATGLKRIVPVLRQQYRNAFPIVQVHDSITFECDEVDVLRLKDDVREAFQQTHTHNGVTVFFPVDVKDGRSWADA
jgi:DNA polymerase